MIRILPNGDLLLTADNAIRSGLAEAYRSGGYPEAESLVLEMLRNGCCQMHLDLIPPENIGALTDAPIVAEADYPDDGSGPVPYPDSPVWWYPDYAIIDPWEQLKNKGRVVLTRAPEARS